MANRFTMTCWPDFDSIQLRPPLNPRPSCLKLSGKLQQCRLLGVSSAKHHAHGQTIFGCGQGQGDRGLAGNIVERIVERKPGNAPAREVGLGYIEINSASCKMR